MLYVIGGDTGPLKIGRAVQPHRRLRAIATGCDRPVRLLFSTAAPINLEADAEAIAHAKLAEARAHGEWFDVALERAQEAILTAVEAVERGEVADKKSVGRKMLYPEKREAAFEAGTVKRVTAVLHADEPLVAFIRTAVEAELARREKG